MSAIIKSHNISSELNAGEYNKITVSATDDELGTSALAEPISYSGGELTYAIAKDGDYYICTGVSELEATQIVIPPTHKGTDGIEKEVKEIGPDAFKNLTSMVSVSLPSTLTKIGAYAFSRCGSLTNIEIPKSVTTIAAGAFSYSGLKTITFSSGSELTEIGTSAFQAAPLATITLPNKLKVIGNAAFQSCSLKCDLIIPDSVTEIRGAAFSYSGITGLYMGNCAVTTINMNTFDNCKSLEEVRTNPVLDTIDKNAFRNCEKLTTVVFGASVKWISSYAFNGCTKLGTCNFIASHGWFYTSGVSVPEKISDGENCTHVTSITPLMLSQNLTAYNFFRIDTMPAPTISMSNGMLTITDLSGLADYFHIYINGKDPITIFAKPIIEAGTWVANEDFALPTSSMSDAILAFKSHNGHTDATAAECNFVGMKWQNYSTALGYYTMLSYSTSFTAGTNYGVYTLDGGWKREECKTLIVPENTEVNEAYYNWFVANFTKVNEA